MESTFSTGLGFIRGGQLQPSLLTLVSLIVMVMVGTGRNVSMERKHEGIHVGDTGKED